MYGKFHNNEFIEDTNPLITATSTIHNPTPAHYLAAGYKLVIEEDYPGDGNYYEENITETETNIIKGWILAEEPEVYTPPTPPVDPIIAELESLREQLEELQLGVAELRSLII